MKWASGEKEAAVGELGMQRILVSVEREQAALEVADREAWAGQELARVGELGLVQVQAEVAELGRADREGAEAAELRLARVRGPERVWGAEEAGE